jgi:NitT/TauT family transport system substrate-binding protein
MEIWHSRDGISSYATLPEFLTAVAKLRSTGAKLNATYVYDKITGLKLFGKTAFFVQSSDGFSTFLRKPDADAFAAKVGGKVIDFEAALASVSG